ncbi:exopolyphosphatase/guanosine-5'-triphosphate,3'-diphosphate pyrophosphatase [Hamadaea flava]|uniref:Exopolyphosphatase n=1 Tax=Hamadaea flava TaxID=1742688 RepID=A0ABV8LH80_9ACTN|nr:Ppx/GppA phosphatase family protein [Hamadaea flava]MCP2326608.1 exopolyphosphatase/guanosine-5'-triphosphate,3'-diphosphate pyrophosphatase [Hamadaea flava]
MTRVAAIDCGTNSIRLLIADFDGDRATDVSRRMEIVRLGQGVDATGRLAPEAIERTRAALSAYKSEIDEAGVTAVRMVATSATRDAANAADFHDMVLATLGSEPEVVSGEEEARLSFAGAVRGLDAEPPFLVVDIGGGSTEFVLGDNAGVSSAISVDIGCVRMTERHLHSDPPELDELAAATADIGKAVDHALTVVPGTQARTLVGLAGSVTTVTAIALGLTSYQSERIHRARVSKEEVALVTAGLAEMTHDQRAGIGVMHPGRVDVIVAGALILRTIMEKTGLSTVLASEHDILDGIALSLLR